MTSFGSPAVDGLERLTVTDFRKGALGRSGVWAVAFLAEWCGFCRRFAPQFAQLVVPSAHFAVADLSNEENPLWERFGVEAVPTVLVFRDGALVLRADGRLGEGLDRTDLERIRAALR